jgi:hypothetical protein
MSCVLRATGNDFQVESFLPSSSFFPCNVFLKGELRSKDSAWDSNGLTIEVSEAASNNLVQQIQDALDFLQVNKSELIRLRNYSGLEMMSLDFRVDRRDVFIQSNFFPSNLITLAGELELCIELSIYGQDQR